VAELKTRKTDASVAAFLAGVKDERKRRDAQAILDLMKKVTGEEPKMWGTSIIGFGSYRYKHDSGKAGEWPVLGFSPRKQNLTMYLMDGAGRHEAALKKLGKHKTGVGCLYVTSLDDIDVNVLQGVLTASVKNTTKKKG